MICKKCGNMYNENESIFCPKCGETSANDNSKSGYEYNSQANGQTTTSDDEMNKQADVHNSGIYGQTAIPNNGMYGQTTIPNNGVYGQTTIPNNGMYGQTAIPNMGTYGQPVMMLQGAQYQQYAGRYYPGLSKSDLFRFQWLKKYNTAIRVLSILMYVIQALMLISLIIAIAEAVSVRSYYRHIDSDLIRFWSIDIAFVVIMLILSVLAHVKKSRVAAGFVMGFYILSILCQMLMLYTSFVALTLMFSIIVLGLSVSIFVLDIVYNSKWNTYQNTGIIPVR